MNRAERRRAKRNPEAIAEAIACAGLYHRTPSGAVQRITVKDTVRLLQRLAERVVRAGGKPVVLRIDDAERIPAVQGAVTNSAGPMRQTPTAAAPAFLSAHPLGTRSANAGRPSDPHPRPDDV